MHQTLTNGVPYYYRVVPLYGATEGELSNEVSATPQAPITQRVNDWIV